MEMEPWMVEAVERAREKLGWDPGDEYARRVLEEAAEGKCESFEWFVV